MTYFELMFIKVKRTSIGSFICTCISTYSHSICFKYYFLSIKLSLHLCLKKKKQLTTHVWIYFWVLHSLILISCLFLLPIPHCLSRCKFILSLKIHSVSPPNLFVFFRIVLTILASLPPFHTKYKIGFSISMKIW